LSDSLASSLRSRLPKIFTRSNVAYGGDVTDLIKIVRVNHPKADIALMERAFKTAEHHHSGQKRKSGEEYITHPLAVARILADLGSGPATIAAALLHDTIEDTEYSLEQLTIDFGAEVALLVDGVTKLDRVKFGDSAQSETMRKMVVAMSKDVRVLVIKLADRLHNARTWGFVNPESARRKAQETLEIYAPLAHRLGISTIKLELEDISFAVLYPKVYEEIVTLVGQRNPSRSEYTEKVLDEISTELRNGKVKSKIDGRPKQYYSIYQKMVTRGREFDDIYDLVGVRVIVGTVKDCYAALGSLHARWSPLPGRFKDYIAMPKFNLYQSLHTTVVGPEGRAVEIQIRTQEMHQRAEYGVAAHWKYKANVGKDNDKEVDFAWLKQLSDWQEETSDPGEFLENLRFEIGAKELYVFTPKGKVVGLSAGSTPIDFAYAVHTQVGHKTIGAKVNGRLVPLETKLQAGDVIEILTSKSESAGPSKDWLNFVGSASAKAKIKHFFTQERKELATEDGKESLVKSLRRQGLPIQSMLNGESLSRVAADLKLEDINALFTSIGQGVISAASVIDRVRAIEGGTEADTEEIMIQVPKGLRGPRRPTQGVLVKGSSDVLTKMARCCTPVPGDEIIGFITRGEGVSVHRSDCKNVISLNQERVVEVGWASDSRGVFMVQIQVEALDRSGLLSDVTRVLSENHVNILSASVTTGRDRVALSKFVFEMADPSHLDHLLNQVKRIEAVYDVYRVKSS
jgi:GTP diphosphokinase / guanosine-3',5'-bis(diphosphate) 3'-diphosphatase